ncbi:hypothetical protein CW705_07805 [Candidatus Bathyarchaeota archaeon]|nr:MAG: hypothetical protein CW705_07805 [Candidatus Bathyarchaeota archaeon]
MVSLLVLFGPLAITLYSFLGGASQAFAEGYVAGEGVGRALGEILGFNPSTSPHDADTFVSLKILASKHSTE